MEVIYFRHNRALPPPAIERHLFAICELTFVEAGELVYRISGREVHAAAGDAVFVAAGSIRERREGPSADYVSFNFKTAPVPELSPYLPAVLCEAERALIAAADAIAARHDAGADAQMGHLVSCLLAGIEGRFAREREHPLVRRIKQYVELHLRDKISLREIGEETYFSPIYCETVFKKETGRSLMRYVTDRRMAEAQKLLLEGTLSLREIAESVGYADYNYFARTFKKATGHTPKNARMPMP